MAQNALVPVKLFKLAQSSLPPAFLRNVRVVVPCPLEGYTKRRQDRQFLRGSGGATSDHGREALRQERLFQRENHEDLVAFATGNGERYLAVTRASTAPYLSPTPALGSVSLS